MSRHFTIECEDIILREYRLEDLDELYALTQQPEITEFLPGWDVPREQRRHWLANYETVENKRFLAAVAAGGDVQELRLRLGIVLKETGELIGWCCTGIKDELPPPNREIMYAISRHHRNKGYTTQATRGLIRFLFGQTKVEELIALALVRNVPSNRVIQKCGFEFIRQMILGGERYGFYIINKEKWAQVEVEPGIS